MIIFEHYENSEFAIKVYTITSFVCVVLDLIAELVFLIMAGKYSSLVYLT